MIPRTFDEVVASRAAADPTGVVLRQLRFGEGRGDSVVDAASLDARVRTLAGALAAGTVPGDRALVLVPPGLDHLVAVLACFRARLAAVTSMPSHGRRGREHLARLVRSARPSLAIVDASSAAVPPSLPTVLVDSHAPLHDRGSSTEDDVAVIQYTSGSTGHPRGVVLRHGHLFEHARRLAHVAGLEASQRTVTWLPPYHDMGLIGGLLAPLVAGAEIVMFTPAEFAARPERWLEAIATHRATFSGGPDFAYARLASRARPTNAALDLSSWRVAFTGAERVRAATLDAFGARFAASGFDARAFAPCYGMAEATLAISIHDPRRGSPSRLRIDASELERGRVRLDATGGVELVSNGLPMAGVEVRIVDPVDGTRLGPLRAGEVHVRSETGARAYFEDPAASLATFGAEAGGSAESGWLRTGDLGFLHGGELYVAGRSKDAIVVAGRNLHPEDLEETAEGAHPDVLSHGACAFSVDAGDVERVIVHVESSRRTEAELDSIADAVRSALVLEHDLPRIEVVVGRRGSIPRTSSGKPRRRELRARFLEAGPATVSATTEANDVDESSILLARVAEVAARVLGLPSIDAEDELLDLGAQSEALTRLAVALSEALDTAVPVELVFREPSAKRLAAALAARAREIRPPPIRKAAGPFEARLGMSQRRMWWLHALEPSSSAYHVAFAIDLEGALDARAMRRSIDLVLLRHDALRTRYVREAGEVVPILDAVANGIAEVTCGEIELEPWLERFATEPFDLESSAPVRVALVRLSEARSCVAFAVHHVAIDGAAVDVLASELFAAYEAFARGDEPELEPVQLGYSDFVAYEHARAGKGSYELARRHFEDRLRGLPPVLALPLDRPRPSAPDSRGRSHRFELPRVLVEALGRIAATRGATTYVGLHATFALFLARHGATDDVAVAIPVANRVAPGSERIVGSLVNTLVLRTELSPRINFLEMIDRVRDESVAALAHQDYPFERLVEALVGERSASHAPIAQVMFDFQRHPSATGRVGGLVVRGRGIARAHAQFDLALSIVDLGDRFEATFEYRTSLFDASTVERFATRFRALLESVTADPFQEVRRAHLVPPGELAIQRAHLVGAAPRDAFRSLVESFAARVRERPSRPALVAGTVATTYGELHSRMEWIALSLQSVGVRRGDRVAVLLSRSVDLVAGLLAVLRIGASYVPLDPSHPTARLASILEDAAPRALLVDAPSALALPPGGERLVVSVDALPTIEGALPTLVIDPEDMAYVLFTSGTTGRPKGVRITHGSLANFLGSMAREPGLAPGERLLAITTLSFDIAALELFLPLTVGGTVVLASRDEVLDSRALRERLEAGTIDVVQATPSTFRSLLDAGFVARPPLRLFVGGEALPAAVAEDLLRHGASLFNLYGPTETTVWSTVARVEAGAPITLGHPIEGTELRIADGHGEMVPLGVEGELWIGGVGVAAGYLARPELDRARFVEAEGATGAGTRFYRTGDRVRLLENGSLLFLGRTDFQVKLRGHRVELPDVERTLEACPGVARCVAIVHARASNDERLVAFCEGEIDAEVVRAHAMRSLPAYMVPAHFVVVDTLPTTPNGKVDRAALVFLPERDVTVDDEMPTTPTEIALGSIFSRVLGVDSVARETSFFDVGGHSLLAVRVFAAIERDLGVRLPLRTLFSHPTVRALAAEVEAVRAEDDGSLLRIKAGDSPIVVVHASSDDETLARAIAERTPGRAMLVLRPPARPFVDLDPLAASYVATLASAGVGRGATLVGVGLGGNVAHAMASQLEAQGRGAERVVLVESLPPNSLVRLAQRARSASPPMRARTFADAAIARRYRDLEAPYDRAYVEHETPSVRAPVVCFARSRLSAWLWGRAFGVRYVSMPETMDALADALTNVVTPPSAASRKQHG